MSETPPDPWRCQVCGREFAVPSLARDCEEQHAGHPVRAKDVPALIQKRIG